MCTVGLERGRFGPRHHLLADGVRPHEVRAQHAAERVAPALA